MADNVFEMELCDAQYKGFPFVPNDKKTEVTLGEEEPDYGDPDAGAPTSDEVQTSVHNVSERLKDLGTHLQSLKDLIQEDNNPISLHHRVYFNLAENPFDRDPGPSFLDSILSLMYVCCCDLGCFMEFETPDCPTEFFTDRWLQVIDEFQSELDEFVKELQKSARLHCGHDLHKVLLKCDITLPTNKVIDFSVAGCMFLQDFINMFLQITRDERAPPSPGAGAAGAMHFFGESDECYYNQPEEEAAEFSDEEECT